MFDVVVTWLSAVLCIVYFVGLYRLEKQRRELDLLTYKRAVELLRRSEARIHRESDTHHQCVGVFVVEVLAGDPR